ncbi:hypothetical protein [uncultured Proteiniphilum sp.]|nr:hypothetical protein [uncultured Proteiniphilum sp.]
MWKNEISLPGISFFFCFRLIEKEGPFSDRPYTDWLGQTFKT